MTKLLLITDIPRLSKVFSRFSDEKDIRLRIVNNLEMGGEEIAADKPAMVFVQPHLSGLSPDILLMHLKKQLGRRRSRFVLLTTPEQVSNETLKLYHGYIDTSLNDNELFDAIRVMISDPAPKGKKVAPTQEVVSVPDAPLQAISIAETQSMNRVGQPVSEELPGLPMQPEKPDFKALHHMTDTLEPSLEEQGVTYSPRSRVSVYSEFTSSFDNAVSSIQPAKEPAIEPEYHHKEHSFDWSHEVVETIEPEHKRSKKATFILWFAPLLFAVVVVTLLQHKSSKSKPVDISAQTPAIPTQGAIKQSDTKSPAVVETKQVPAVVTPTAPAGPQPGNQTAVAGADAKLSDRAVLLDIAENRGKKDQAKSVPANSRLTALPDFIPRSGLDKQYSAANPGWERYKGSVTEFKIFRENNTIKAIQVIDRGGQGVPESFMKAVLRQISKKPVLLIESSEKKDGYVIQHGQVSEDLKVVYYRDENGGRLRAFVTTWK